MATTLGRSEIEQDRLAAWNSGFIPSLIVITAAQQLAAEFASNRHDTPTDQMKIPSVLQTILRSYRVQSVNRQK
jgi:hypothetical protein